MKFLLSAGFFLCVFTLFFVLVSSGSAWATEVRYRSYVNQSVCTSQGGTIVQKRVTYYPGYTVVEYAPYQTYQPYQTYYFGANGWGRAYGWNRGTHFGTYPNWAQHKRKA